MTTEEQDKRRKAQEKAEEERKRSRDQIVRLAQISTTNLGSL